MLRRVILAELTCALAGFLAIEIYLIATRDWRDIAAGAIAPVLIFLLAKPLARWALAPGRTILDTVKQLEGGGIDRLAAHHGPPEIRKLVECIIAAADALLATNGLNNIAVTDFVHQFRSQVHILAIHIDRMTDDLTADGAATLALVKTDIARLNNLLAEEAEKARGDGNTPFAEIDVRSVIQERITAWSDAASLAGGVAVKPTRIDSAVIMSRPGILEHLLDILLDNAIRYSPEQGEIRVGAIVDEDAGNVVIQVIDDGPGMTAEQKRHATERGWQADPAAGQGSGLGLSIADILIRSNRGKLTLHTAPSGHGLDARIQFRVVTHGATGARRAVDAVRRHVPPPGNLRGTQPPDALLPGDEPTRSSPRH